MFDKKLDRKHHHAMKWVKYPDDMIPLWVADMDFEAPEAIKKALQHRLQQADLGYTLPWESLYKSVIDWCQSQYQWNIQSEHIVWLPGVVPAFNVACKLFNRGKVLVQTPNYPPLLQAAQLNNQQLITCSVLQKNDRWQLDFIDLEQKLSDPECGLFILCNPMNPHGSMLSQEELKLIVRLCARYRVQLCSDEIHCDLVFSGQHYPAGKYSDSAITFMAASKSFNVAGLGCSFAVIRDPKLRMQYQRSAMGIVPWPNLLGYVATEAAFLEGLPWLLQLRKYLQSNRDYLIKRLSAMTINKQPVFSTLKNEACFFSWVDCRVLEYHTQEKAVHTFEQAKLVVSDGADFFDAGFVRINFACTRALLEQAMNQLEQRINNYECDFK